jgi:flagellar motility protein MotE (MotC chaperone)
MISKAEALNTSGLSVDQMVKKLEAEIDDQIKRWRGGKITIKLNQPGVTSEVADKLVEIYTKGGWRAMCTTVKEGMQWDTYDVPALVLE